MGVSLQDYQASSFVQFMNGGAETQILAANPERVVVCMGGTSGSSFFWITRVYVAGQPFTFVSSSTGGLVELTWEKHGLLVTGRVTVELVTVSADFSWYELLYKG